MLNALTDAKILRSLADCDSRAGAPLGKAMLEAADTIEAQAALIAEARRLFAYVAGDDEWDTETIANGVDDQWALEVRAFFAKLDAAK